MRNRPMLHLRSHSLGTFFVLKTLSLTLPPRRRCRGGNALSTCSSRRTCSMRRERKERPRPPRPVAPETHPEELLTRIKAWNKSRREAAADPRTAPVHRKCQAMLSTARFPTRRPKRSGPRGGDEQRTLLWESSCTGCKMSPNNANARVASERVYIWHL